MDTKKYTYNGYVINLGGAEINFEHGYALYEGSLYLGVSYTEYGEIWTDIVGPINNIKDFYRLVHRDAQEYKLPILEAMEGYGLCTIDDVAEYHKKDDIKYIRNILENMDDKCVIELLQEYINKKAPNK